MAKRSEVGGSTVSTEELRKADKAVGEKFRIANKGDGPAIPEYGPALGGLVHRVFDIGDPDELFDEVVAAVADRDALTPGHLRTQLAQSADLIRRAHLLYINSREAYQRFEHEYAEMEGSMRDRATIELELEKRTSIPEERDAKGKPVMLRTKTITDADVVARIAHAFGDVWREAANRKLRADKMLDHLAHLVRVTERRHTALQKLIGSKEEL